MPADYFILLPQPSKTWEWTAHTFLLLWIVLKTYPAMVLCSASVSMLSLRCNACSRFGLVWNYFAKLFWVEFRSRLLDFEATLSNSLVRLGLGHTLACNFVYSVVTLWHCTGVRHASLAAVLCIPLALGGTLRSWAPSFVTVICKNMDFDFAFWTLSNLVGIPCHSGQYFSGGVFLRRPTVRRPGLSELPF